MITLVTNKEVQFNSSLQGFVKREADLIQENVMLKIVTIRVTDICFKKENRLKPDGTPFVFEREYARANPKNITMSTADLQAKINTGIVDFSDTTKLLEKSEELFTAIVLEDVKTQLPFNTISSDWEVKV